MLIQIYIIRDGCSLSTWCRERYNVRDGISRREREGGRETGERQRERVGDKEGEGETE